jgi:hypothetical protein
MNVRTIPGALALVGLLSLISVGCGGAGDAEPESAAETAPRPAALEDEIDAGQAELVAAADRVEDASGAPIEGVALDGTTLEVWKTSTCGCCGKWVDHMKAAGFEVAVHEVSQQELTGVKRGKGITPELASCHTAEIGGYVVEGHVPAEDLKRLLAERPADVEGIAVPGMPTGSPGMEDPDRPADAYDVVTFTSSGETEVFASH